MKLDLWAALDATVVNEELDDYLTNTESGGRWSKALYFLTQENKRYVQPFLERALTDIEIPKSYYRADDWWKCAVMSSAYCEEEGRVVLKLPENLAPYKFCVSPLLKNKPELVERAREVFGMLKDKYTFVTWDDSGNIGKRYKKQDEIGTPKCVVVDFESLEDGTVTVRDRDTMEQVRVKVEEL